MDRSCTGTLPAMRNVLGVALKFCSRYVLDDPLKARAITGKPAHQKRWDADNVSAASPAVHRESSAYPDEFQ